MYKFAQSFACWPILRRCNFQGWDRTTSQAHIKRDVNEELTDRARKYGIKKTAKAEKKAAAEEKKY